ncbi:GNAT family N-acetyltransferase [Flagellimonas meridianipacifica]|uniref:Phosphinothricin acetyltransferase n=1 Tax=Flagellimonas meridianipacifica TaxID=1080225 RepID=A0A2T0M810_9FLAO|nr:GNAT family N-acetyltransferase [Allomuricauda pacifica]PRX53676.1 phosphinothricin acetyltransferase [Allomuricauda pacifica]
MKIIIRKAEERDVTEILDIVNYEILNSTVLYDYKKRTYQQQLVWFEKKQIDKMPIIVAEIENRVAGFGTYGIFRPWAAYQFSVEHSIYVHRDMRANGVGKKLLSKLIELAKDNGFHTMIAGVDGSNEKSFEFHKNFGFEEIGTFKEIGFKFDKWLDLRFLQLFLK